MGSDVQTASSRTGPGLACTKSPLLVCSGHVSVTAALSAGHPCPSGQIDVTPHPCTVTNVTGNNAGSRCTLFLNYYYFIAIYK